MPSYVCQNLNLFLSKWCSTRKMATQDSTFILYEHTEAKMQEELPLHWDFEMLNLESIDINSIYNNFYCTIKKQNALKSYTLHFDNNKKKKKLNRIGKQQFNSCFDILFLFCFVCCICFRCCFLLRKLKTKIAGYQTSVCINNVAMSLASDYIHSGTCIYKRTRHRHLTDIVLSV